MNNSNIKYREKKIKLIDIYNYTFNKYQYQHI